MLDKNIMLALNGADDAFLEETARKLEYNTETKERIVPMTNYRKRTSRRFVSILVAACLLLSLGIVAYAADLFGIRALLIKSDKATPAGFEAGGYFSVTQPQEVPEEMDDSINRMCTIKLSIYILVNVILAVFFFAKLGLAYFDYRNKGQFEWTGPAILFACLVFTLTAPNYIWGIVGL